MRDRAVYLFTGMGSPVALLTAVMFALTWGGVAIQQAVAQEGAPQTIGARAQNGTTTPNSKDGDWEARFRSHWTTVQFSQVRNNPLHNQDTPLTHTDISISADIEIVNATNLLALSSYQTIVLKAVDSQGRDLRDIFAEEHRREAADRRYRALAYDRSFDHQTREWTETLRPQRIRLRMDAAKKIPAHISRVDGYVVALIADKLEHVDIPFSPSDTWTEVLPGQRVRLSKASKSEESYMFSLEEHPDSARDVFHGRVSTDMPLPERIVVPQTLIGPTGKVIQRVGGSDFPRIGSMRSSGGIAEDADEIAAWRYVIAIRARERRVPFALINVALPAVGAGSALGQIVQPDQ